MVKRLFLTVPWGCLRFVIVVFPDHTHLLFLLENLTLVINSKRLSNAIKKLDIMRQSECLVVNPITVYSYGFPFNCTTVGQA